MITILLEVKSNSPNRIHDEFYNPSPSNFRKFPRTEKGMQKAIKELVQTVEKNQAWITEYRFIGYNGKYESYKKDIQPLFIIDSIGNILQ
jgi:hypothetical protein